MAKKKKTVSKEKIDEVFEIETNGKEEIIETHKEIEEKPSSKKEVEEQNKILRNILITLGLITIFGLVFFFTIEKTNNIDYRGVNFEKIKEQDLIFYNTQFPVFENGKIVANYNFYLRKNPLKTAEIPFEGEFNPKEIIVIETEREFSCDGDQVIAVANLANVVKFFNIELIQDPNATCDSEGRYMHVRLEEGEENKIVQTGPSCYNLQLKDDCEILSVTERFILEFFVRGNEIINEVSS